MTLPKPSPTTRQRKAEPCQHSRTEVLCGEVIRCLDCFAWDRMEGQKCDLYRWDVEWDEDGQPVRLWWVSRLRRLV